MPNSYLTIDDFLKNDSFINYCCGVNEPDIQYWKQFQENNPEKREIMEEAVRHYSLLFGALAEMDRQEQAEQFRKKLEDSESARVISLGYEPAAGKDLFKRWSVAMAGAAVVLLIAGYLFLRRGKEEAKDDNTAQQYFTKTGEKRMLLLPDGTRVTLNAGTAIRLDKSFGQHTREVFLKGEAFFDVWSNKALPFTVHTTDMDVQALGTSFNVKSYDNDRKSETVLIQGLVEVNLKKDGNRKLILHPNEKLTWMNKNAVIDAVAGPEKEAQQPESEHPIVSAVKKTAGGEIKEVAWVESNLVFEDDSFEDIALQLDRWYGVHIQFSNGEAKRYRFTATFKKEKIENVLEMLKLSKKFNYVIDGQQSITIYK